MIDVFLSASIPLPGRDKRYYSSRNVIAIREAIKSLVEIVLPSGRITCGGHPTITPLIAFFVKQSGFERNRLTVFQSEFFEGEFPAENSLLQDMRIVRGRPDRLSSLLAMREEMIQSRRFDAGVFIGGMEGVEAEARLFAELQPRARILPVASSGGAAANIFEGGQFQDDLRTDLTYHTLFRRYLLPLRGRLT